MPSTRSRTGFTLVELLVVIAIIGVLVALLLPAVQAAREAARRSQCTNNLKQIGLGLHNYHDIRKVFPPGFDYTGSSYNNKPSWGWAVHILPYIEEGALYDVLDPAKRPLNDVYTSSSTAADKRALRTRIDVYRCPSDTMRDLNNKGKIGSDPYDIATSSYKGSSGTTLISKNKDGGGVFWGGSEIGMAHITDGTSKTFAVGECTEMQKGGHWAGVGKTTDANDNGLPRTLGRSNFVLNFDYQAAGQPVNKCKGFGSKHSNGANFLLCDGSVHFISENSDSNLMKNLGNRKDGKAVTLP